MPELPEIETLRLQLSNIIIGKKIKAITIRKNKSFIGDPAVIYNSQIMNIRRFAKILVIDFNNNLSLAVHLKMSGQLLYKGKAGSGEGEVIKHTRVILTFSDGNKLYFNDMRIFGWMRVIQNQKSLRQSSGQAKVKSQKYKSKLKIPSIDEVIGHLGPDPLKELDEEKFYEILQTSKRPIKLVLMDQEKIAGVGNIYANDALFLSRINPKKKANKLLNGQIIKLLGSLKRVLTDGIKWRGASRNNFRDIYGKKGEVQEHFLVYDRVGYDCPNKCGGKIKKIRLGGRGTFYCPNCQK